MNIQTQPQQSYISDSLRQVAMLADISCTGLGLSRTDSKASRKAEADHAARDGASNVRVYRFAGADDEIRAIMGLQELARANLAHHSMAWGAGKRRILPNANFQPWIGKQAAIEEDFKRAVKTLADNADDILARARHNIGSFDISLPSKDEMTSSFSLRYELEPIPDGRQFEDFDRGTFGMVDTLLRERFEANVAAAAQAAQLDAVRSLFAPLERLADRLETYSKREQDLAAGKSVPLREGVFRDTLVENLQEMVEVFAAKNILGDAKLDEIAAKLKPFMKINADMLRKRGDIRDAVTERAKEIMKDLGVFMP